MALFRRSSDDTDEATQQRIDWLNSAPPWDVAAELMPVFADYAEADRGEFVTYLFRDVPGKPSIEDLKQPILEAVQVLEHAELIYLNYVSDLDTRRWSATRLGLQMLDDGKSAIRQRIKDRIGA